MQELSENETTETEISSRMSSNENIYERQNFNNKNDYEYRKSLSVEINSQSKLIANVGEIARVIFDVTNNDKALVRYKYEFYSPILLPNQIPAGL